MKLDQLQEFEWNDPFSDNLLRKEGLAVVAKEMIQIQDGVRYNGEWSGAIRHGRGT